MYAGEEQEKSRRRVTIYVCESKEKIHIGKCKNKEQILVPEIKNPIVFHETTFSTPTGRRTHITHLQEPISFSPHTFHLRNNPQMNHLTLKFHTIALFYFYPWAKLWSKGRHVLFSGGCLKVIVGNTRDEGRRRGWFKGGVFVWGHHSLIIFLDLLTK